jgi:hypothetical protein
MMYFFAIFMVIVGMIGGWWMFKLSNENYEEASFGYGALGLIWALVCLGIAAKVAI